MLSTLCLLLVCDHTHFCYLVNFRMLLLLPQGAEILNFVDSQGKCIEMECVKISIIYTFLRKNMMATEVKSYRYNTFPIFIQLGNKRFRNT